MTTAPREVLLYVFDGFCEWEPSLAAAEINRSGRYRVVAVARHTGFVTSAGGLRAIPEAVMDQAAASRAAMLIIPGGELWERDAMPALAETVKLLLKQRVTVAAIGSATLFLARHRLLDKAYHTGSSKSHLKERCPSYCGELFFQKAPCVSRGPLITAGGAASIEFAGEILRKLRILHNHELDLWLAAHRRGGE